MFSLSHSGKRELGHFMYRYMSEWEHSLGPGVHLKHYNSQSHLLAALLWVIWLIKVLLNCVCLGATRNRTHAFGKIRMWHIPTSLCIVSWVSVAFCWAELLQSL